MIDATLPGIAMTVEAFERWLDTHFASPYSPKTRRVYRSVISQMLVHSQKQGVRHFSELNKAWLRSFITVNQDAGTMYSRTYQTLRCAALNIFWTWLVEKCVVSDNPVSAMLEERRQDRIGIGPRPAGGKVPHRLPSVLMWEDQRALLDVVKRSKWRTSLRDHALIALILATGIRCEELCEAKIAHLSLTYKRMRVVGKGNKERIIEFGHDAQIVGIMETWLEERASLMKWLGAESPYLFVSRTGRALTESLVYQQVSKYIKEAGLQTRVNRKGPHVLRHTAASIMFARQVPLLQIQNNLGHGDLTTTQIYAHLLPQEIGRAECPFQ